MQFNYTLLCFIACNIPYLTSQAVHISRNNSVRLECLSTCTNTPDCTHVSMVGSTCNVHITSEAILTRSENQTSIVIYKHQTRKL